MGKTYLPHPGDKHPHSHTRRETLGLWCLITPWLKALQHPWHHIDIDHISPATGFNNTNVAPTTLTLKFAIRIKVYSFPHSRNQEGNKYRFHRNQPKRAPYFGLKTNFFSHAYLDICDPTPQPDGNTTLSLSLHTELLLLVLVLHTKKVQTSPSLTIPTV